MYKNQKYRRLILGLLIIVLIFILILLSKVIEKNKDIANLVNYENCFKNNVSDIFSSEVINTKEINANSVKVDDGNNVVSFNLPKEAKESFVYLKNYLQKRKWNYVESGNVYAASFWKDEGKYKWLFLNCIKMNGETNVVITAN